MHKHQWKTSETDDAILKECICGSLARLKVTRVTIEPVEDIKILFSSSPTWEGQ